MQSSETLISSVGRGVCRESFQKHFNIFRPENVHRSIFSDDFNVESGNFGFTHLMDLSPQEVAFFATGSFMERLLFSIMRCEQNFLEVVDFLTKFIVDDPDSGFLEEGKVRAVTRMLLLPSRSETKFLQKRFATGPSHSPFESLAVSHHDRLLSNARLLHSAYTYIPPTRAPPVCLMSSLQLFPSKQLPLFFPKWNWLLSHCFFYSL